MSTAVTDQNQSNEPTQLATRRRVLDNLPSQARTTGDQAAARSRMVRRLRFILPICALLLVAAFFFNTKSNSVDDTFLDDLKSSVTAEELRIASPHFTGTDDKGQPFEISADQAIQSTSAKDVINLDQPRGVQGDVKETTVVAADKGVYRQDQKVLELSDKVTLQHAVGGDIYIFRSPAATVSINDEVVTTDAGVGGEGPDGRALKADRMKAYNAEGRVVFEGNVSMRIYPKDAEKNQTDKKSADDAPALNDTETKAPQ